MTVTPLSKDAVDLGGELREIAASLGYSADLLYAAYERTDGKMRPSDYDTALGELRGATAALARTIGEIAATKNGSR